ncbi:DUF2946 family protein [Limnobacter parvus]|uniref:DUF2946 family protein n=1 Tax=Limnobacter parvus TaxID=2939690 RepID=A0ABT1XEY7_9BURK|nr:DUF2946 family protein [Limnobacter parvus]MCR2745840.1 DUF2946 family protein [Limnobacter parvus]
MDDLVEKALARWPNVPAIAGWLKLSLQGDWLLTGPVPEGLTISHPRILNFMARNYGCETDGRYYFQNGPQKAYVHLAYTPWVYRIHPLENGALMLSTHTGLVGWPQAMMQDEQGRVLIQGEQGIGLLHSNDMDLLASGLQEKNGQLHHNADWAVPEVDPDTLIAARTKLRREKQTSTGQRNCSFKMEFIQSAKVAERFKFNPEPEVNKLESNK